VAVLTSFEERVDRLSARYAGLEAGGATPLAEALLWAAGQLLARRNARKVLLVATDGAYDRGLGRAMTSRLSQAAIETLGIGIVCDVSHLFGRSRSIASIAELPQAMFGLLLDSLAHPV
jgi:Mg-chelatase subunit ChlD